MKIKRPGRNLNDISEKIDVWSPCIIRRDEIEPINGFTSTDFNQHQQLNPARSNLQTNMNGMMKQKSRRPRKRSVWHRKKLKKTCLKSTAGAKGKGL